MAKMEERGREHSKRKVTVHNGEDGPIELWEVPMPRVTLANLPELQAESLRVIRAKGINPDRYLPGSPFGSRLREAVINYHDHPSDSIEGLAARIYEHAAHVRGYMELNATDRAMFTMGELGGLVALFDVYRRVSKVRRDAGIESAEARGAPLEKRIQELAKKLEMDPTIEKDQINKKIAERLGTSPQHVGRCRKKMEQKK